MTREKKIYAIFQTQMNTTRNANNNRIQIPKATTQGENLQARQQRLMIHVANQSYDTS